MNSSYRSICFGSILLPLLLAVGCLTEGRDSAMRLSSLGLTVTKNAPAKLPATERAEFAAGCFWGVEQEFRKTPGVIATAVGFEGGRTPNPTYDEVSEGGTGHAETVAVEFDPKVVSYAQLVDLFFNLHDPTSLNFQGPDYGEQYRSVVFYRTPAQKTVIEAALEKLKKSGEFGQSKIVTQVVPSSTFTRAEEYHQQYVEKGGKASCHFRRPRK